VVLWRLDLGGTVIGAVSMGQMTSFCSVDSMICGSFESHDDPRQKPNPEETSSSNRGTADDDKEQNAAGI